MSRGRGFSRVPPRWRLWWQDANSRRAEGPLALLAWPAHRAL